MKSYKTELREGSPDGLVEDAVAELNAIGEELQEWADSMPDNLQGGEKHEALTTAADTLKSIEFDTADLPHTGVVIKYHVSVPKRRRRQPSRSARVENANAAIEAVVEFYRGLDNDEEASDYADQLKELVMEVEIPSQFG